MIFLLFIPLSLIFFFLLLLLSFFFFFVFFLLIILILFLLLFLLLLFLVNHTSCLSTTSYPAYTSSCSYSSFSSSCMLAYIPGPSVSNSSFSSLTISTHLFYYSFILLFSWRIQLATQPFKLTLRFKLRQLIIMYSVWWRCLSEKMISVDLLVPYHLDWYYSIVGIFSLWSDTLWPPKTVNAELSYAIILIIVVSCSIAAW